MKKPFILFKSHKNGSELIEDIGWNKEGIQNKNINIYVYIYKIKQYNIFRNCNDCYNDEKVFIYVCIFR